MTAKLAGSLLDGVAFRCRFASGLSGCEKGVDIGVAGKVADDSPNGIRMKVKPLSDFIGGCRLVEIARQTS